MNGSPNYLTNETRDGRMKQEDLIYVDNFLCV